MILINLLPYREARRKVKLQQILAAWAAVAVVGLISAWLVDQWFVGRIEDLQERERQQKEEIARLDRELGRITELENKKKAIITRLKTINELKSQRDLPIHLLDELSRAVPDKVWIRSLSANTGGVRITGMAESNAEVAVFMRRLGDSPYFANVDLTQVTHATEQNVKLKSFTLSVSVTTPPPPDAQKADGQPAKGGK